MRIFSIFFFFFVVSFWTLPSVDFALLLGGRGLKQLCYSVQVLFSLCAVFVVLRFISFLISFVLGHYLVITLKMTALKTSNVTARMQDRLGSAGCNAHKPVDELILCH
jgi:hypothetical protein